MTYGTIRVDLERQQPVDLLADRTADTVATWLQTHPGVEVIARDRSPEYARVALLGAPTACQVADRWHLLKNQREALERVVTWLHAEWRGLPHHAHTPRIAHRPLRPPSATERAAGQRARATRLEQYQAVQTLVQQGLSVLQIARRLQISRTTATKFARTHTFPERVPHRAQPSRLDSHEAYLQQRWSEGCTNAQQLWREIVAGIHVAINKWHAGRLVTARPSCRWVTYVNTNYLRQNQVQHFPLHVNYRGCCSVRKRN